jgi:hypothetical protein
MDQFIKGYFMQVHHWVFIAAIVIAFIAYRAKKLGYFDKKDNAEAGVVVDQGMPFPCVLEGSIDMSPMPDRVKALAIEAVKKGITITGDYAADVAAQGGEMTLVGAFKFTIDATGQRVDAESFVNLFGVEYPITGGVEASGMIGIGGAGGAGGTSVVGQIVGGKIVDGKIFKGLMPHIWGKLNGTYRRV